jgi:hypothetical protein
MQRQRMVMIRPEEMLGQNNPRQHVIFTSLFGVKLDGTIVLFSSPDLSLPYDSPLPKVETTEHTLRGFL